MYATIWIALILFCIGEVGRRDRDAGRAAAPLTWWASATGALICAVHIAIAMEVVHGWSHQAAVAATARQAAAVYGLNWGGGIYANYAFVGLWVFEVWRWRANPIPAGARSPVTVWAIRIFYLIMILNAAVIFAAGPRRLAGVAIVAGLLWLWRPAILAGRSPHPS
jgi:hypothetical protein